MADICTDDRFEKIAYAKKRLIDATNIETSKDEMKVLDSFLYRLWQMGWIDKALYVSSDVSELQRKNKELIKIKNDLVRVVDRSLQERQVMDFNYCFSIFCPVEKQLNNQGFTLGNKAEEVEKLFMHIDLLRINGILSQNESDNAYKRLDKRIRYYARKMKASNG